MLSNTLDRISFWSLFTVIVLLPVFFLPFAKIPVESSKILLLVIGLAISVIFWTAARFSDGKIVLPKSSLLLSAGAIMLVTLLSAIFSVAKKVSFFGIMLDSGTFYFILLAFILMLVSSIVLRDSRNAKIVFWGSMISFLVVLLFQALRLFFPQTLSFGVLLGGNTDNLIGTWNALGIFAGFSTIVSLFFLEFFSTGRRTRILLGALIVLSIFFVIAVNYPILWIILGIFSLIIFVYKISLYSIKRQEGGEAERSFPTIPFIVLMVSLLFFVAGQFIGNILPNRLGINSIEVRPSFVTTMNVAKDSLMKDPVFGAGPNRFSEVWSLYKPMVINGTQFWDVSFDQGSGLLPTFAFLTGGLGVLSWLVFLLLLVYKGIKALFMPKKEDMANIENIMFFIMAFYLFVSAFLYSIGSVMFMLAFAFLGAFIGLSAASSKKEVEIQFLNDPRKSFISILGLIFIMLISASAGFKYLERFVSMSYFQKTLTASSVELAQRSISNAASLHPNDLYWRTYAQVYIVNLSNLAGKGTNLSEAEKSDMQTSLDLAIGAANEAIKYDPTNYLNYKMLGLVYESAGSLGVSGSLPKALDAYKKASELNPLNPGIYLSMSRIMAADEKTKDAIDYGKKALSLKNDYMDALLVMSQLLKNQNSTESINYATQALSLDPTNKDLIQYVNSLKGGGSPEVPTTAKDSKEKKQ